MDGRSISRQVHARAAPAGFPANQLSAASSQARAALTNNKLLDPGRHQRDHLLGFVDSILEQETLGEEGEPACTPTELCSARKFISRFVKWMQTIGRQQVQAEETEAGPEPSTSQVLPWCSHSASHGDPQRAQAGQGGDCPFTLKPPTLHAAVAAGPGDRPGAADEVPQQVPGMLHVPFVCA